MTLRLFETGSDERPSKKKKRGMSIVSGVVTNNTDCIKQGKVLVRVPMLGEEVWARLASLGAGSDRGFLFGPQMDDEVLVACNLEDPTDAFIIGGLWGTNDEVPVSQPFDTQTKRVIKTGMGGGVGHQIEFDDASQSITITTSTEQKITMDMGKIELSGAKGAVTITMTNTPPSISIKLGSGGPKIELSSNGISLDAGLGSVTIKGSMISVDATGTCKVSGKPIALN